VLPTSLLANWQQELERFAPTLTTETLHPAFSPWVSTATSASGKKGQGLPKNLDVALTTYGMVSRLKWLAEHPWSLVILDEAQAVKNPGTKQTKSVKALLANSKIALTGTPIENRLGDLWSLFDCICPGLLGSPKVFKGFVKQLEARDTDTYGPLRRLTKPYILRRLKTDKTIIADLPDKTEMTTYCHLSKKQVKLYHQLTQEFETALEAGDTGIQRRGLVLGYLTRFKQVCNHPDHLLGQGEFALKESGKLTRLTSICEEIAARQEKVLIFTQYRDITAMLAEHLAEIFAEEGLVLHGGTAPKRRQTFVDRFQTEDNTPFMVLSLKAGGTGLNLTAANHVIHFDRWWNPAVENQATDRAFRIGQRKQVMVHKFVCAGTIEERIDDMIREKAGLAQQLLSNDGAATEGEQWITEMNNEQLMDLITLDIQQVDIAS
jgi:non-specific serine/threonine protein kinase